MTDVEFAQATLRGDVNDWVVNARQNAQAYLDLHAVHEQTLAEGERRHRWFLTELSAASRRVDEARQAAERERQASAAAVERAKTAEERARHLASMGRDLLARIVLVKDQDLQLERGSGRLVEKYRREFADA